MITVTLGAFTATDAALTSGYGVMVSEEGPVITPGVNRSDAPRGSLPGSSSGREVLAKSQIDIPLMIFGTSFDDAYTRAETVRGQWQPVNTDAELIIAWSDTLSRSYFGRPDPTMMDTSFLPDNNAMFPVVTFWAMDPLAYGDSVSVTGAGTVVVAGTAETERLVVTVHGNGGTPQITNPNGTFLKWGTTLAAGQTRVADCRARTVVNGSTNALAELQAYQEWLTLSPGSNVLTVSGCSSIDITYRPAYA